VLRRLPSLNALKAFEAAARHGSFTKAADELSVTQGAVSHQVKALDLEVVRDAFDRLAVGTNRLLQLQKSGVLTVTTSPNFASKWLIHRLGNFSDAHPEIDLRVSATRAHIDFAREDFDLAIRHGDGEWPGLYVTRLYAEELFPVCSPKFLRGRGALRSPADLRHHTLLHATDRRDWAKWLEAAGATEVDVGRGPVFSERSMGIDAAVDGQGIALARSALAAWDLRAGRLARPFTLGLKVPYAYWIVCPKSTADLPKISTFRDWLLGEAQEDVRSLRRTRAQSENRSK
jgi:LysR family glycine cleavage system transcriptional activator